MLVPKNICECLSVSSPDSKEIEVVQIRDQFLFLHNRFNSRGIKDVLEGDGIHIEGIYFHTVVDADEGLINNLQVVAVAVAVTAVQLSLFVLLVPAIVANRRQNVPHE